jgi:hypothetical protein
MSDEQIPTISDEAKAALEGFDALDWLNGAINAETEITVYRDGTGLLTLAELVELADDATDKEQRETLRKSGLTFKLRSIGTDARDMLLKKLEREERFKAKPATDDEPAVPGRRQHPDFMYAFQQELLSRSIVSATTPTGQVDRGPWGMDRINALREKLPMNEFPRLVFKAHDLHFTQYEIDKLIDLDFSSRP